MSNTRRAIVFATEGGTSEEKATRIFERTRIPVANITTFPIESVDAYDLLIFVVPTYGSGDPPDSSAEIWGKLLSRTTPLKGLKFAVWAMGNSEFGDTFLGFAKKVEAKLKELGATEITALGATDAAEAQSTNFDDWIASLNITLT
jgi:sulfite reductase alpha subunit-like flavoprotein